MACSDCRFWNRLARQIKSTVGPEDAPAGGDDFHRWGKCERQNQPDLPIVIYSQDASDWSSWITTLETFACSEERPQ